MPAYIVFTRERTTNPAELDTYMKEVPTALAGHPIKILAAYGKQEILEGFPVEGVVIAEFPTSAEAKAWYNSPEYQKVVQHRFHGAEYRAVLVDGVTP